MNKNKKYQWGILLVSLALAVSPLINASITITSSNQVIDSVNGVQIDYADDWVSFSNGTFSENLTVDGRVLDTVDFDAWDAAAAGMDGYAYDGKIHNSNGNNWTVNESNLQAAIDDVNGTTNGTVWVPSGCEITLTSTVHIWSNVTLNLQGCTLKSSTNVDTILLYPCSSLISSDKGAVIDVRGATFTNDVIELVPFDSGNQKWEKYASTATKLTAVDNINIISDNHEGTGIHLHVDANGENICFLTFRHLYISNFSKGINLETDNAASWVNGNFFENIFGNDCEYFIYLDENGNEISGNIFDNIQYQAGDTGNIEVIHMIDNCDNNYFTNFFIWDWYTPYPDQPTVNMTTANAWGNTFYGNGFYHNFELKIIGGSYSNIDVLGSSSFSMRSAFECLYINFFQDSDTGTQFYAHTDYNPWTYYWGNVSGTLRNGSHRIESDGDWNFSTEIGDILLNPSGGDVSIFGNLSVSGSFSGASVDGYYLNGTIQNTQGNSFPLTDAGLRSAIADCNHGDTVFVGGDVCLHSTLDIPVGVIVDFMGHNVTVNSSFTVFRFRWLNNDTSGLLNGAGLRNVQVNLDNVSFVDNAIEIHNTGSLRGDSLLIQNVKLFGEEMHYPLNSSYWNGTGVYMHTDYAIGQGAIAGVLIDGLTTRAFEYGILMNATNDSYLAGYNSYINANKILNWVDYESKYPLEMRRDNASCKINGNYFTDFGFQSKYAYTAINCSGDRNSFEGVIWDIGNELPDYTINITGNYNYFEVACPDLDTTLNDDGVANVIIDLQGGCISFSTIYPYGTSLFHIYANTQIHENLSVTGYITATNGTFSENLTVDGRVLDTVDFDAWDAAAAGLDGYFLNGTIQNSNGNSWVCSHTADNTANINAAINDLGGSEGTVYLPGGRVPFSNKIYIKNYTHLKGQGENQTILIKRDNNGQTGIVCHGVNGWVISDLTVHGNSSYSGGSHTAASGNIYIYGCDNWTVRNIRCVYATGSLLSMGSTSVIDVVDYGDNKNWVIQNYEGYSAKGVQHGINIGEDSHLGQLSNIRCHNVSVGIDFGGGSYDVRDIDLTNIHLYDCDSHGIKFTHTRRVSFDNVNISATANGIKFQNDAVDIKFTNSEIYTTGNHGVFIMSDDGPLCHHLTFVNVNITVSTGGSSDSVVSIQSDCHNLTFIGCTLKDGSGQGFYIDGAFDIKIIGCRIVNPNTHGVWLLGGARDIDISHCTFDGGANGNGGILGQSCSWVDITYNTFRGWADDGVDFTTATVANNFSIIGNNFRGNTKAIDVAANCDNFIIDLNRCIGDNIDLNANVSDTRICPDTNLATIDIT